MEDVLSSFSFSTEDEDWLRETFNCPKPPSLEDRVAQLERLNGQLLTRVSHLEQLIDQMVTEGEPVEPTPDPGFDAFLESAFAREHGARITRKVLREQYEQWCQKAGLRAPLSARQMRARLLERGVSELTVRGTRMWVGLQPRNPS